MSFRSPLFSPTEAMKVKNLQIHSNPERLDSYSHTPKETSTTPDLLRYHPFTPPGDWRESCEETPPTDIRSSISNSMPSLQKDLEQARCRKSSATIATRLYRRRYLMLFMCAMCSMMNAVPSFQYVVVADIVECYFGVSFDATNWTSLVYMVVFLPLVFPVMYMMEKKGLRFTLLIGALLNCLGSLVQLGSTSPDRFYVVMVAQTLFAVGQVMILSLPPIVAGVWFGAGEVGLACALGVFGNQMGYALGFIVPPLVITNDCQDQVNITFGFSLMAYVLAAVNCALLFIIFMAFEDKPAVFPSTAQATKQEMKTEYGKSLKNLFKDVPFVCLVMSYGLITGTYFSISTMINEMVLVHFPGEEMDAGWMGSLMVFSGMGGSILLGSLLDKTHKFKEISLVVFVLSFMLMASYTGLIVLEVMWVQFVLMAFLGFFMTGYLPVGFDFAAEITYPEPEAMSASLLNASTQLFSIIETLIAAMLLEKYGDFASNMFFSGCLLLGVVITACIKCELKRTTSGNEKN